jgi:hypothetical protein
LARINLSGAQNAPNIAEILINDDHVKIELEIFANDLVDFDRLIPEEFFAGTSIKRAPLDPDSTISKEPIGFMTYHKGAPLHDFRYLPEPGSKRSKSMPG